MSLARQRDYLYACDVCGRSEMFSKMKYIGLNRWSCPDERRYLTAEQLARHRGNQIPSLLTPGKPRKHAQEMRTVGSYQASEAAIFNTLAKHALTSHTVALSGATVFSLAAGGSGGRNAAAVYFGDVIQDGTRPSGWDSVATSFLTTAADAILAVQYGSPSGPAPSEATTSIRYGMVLTGSSTSAFPGAALAGIALLRAYQITGLQKYRDGVTRALAFTRTMQRTDAWTSGYVVGSSGGTDRLRTGGWPAIVDASKSIAGTVFNLDGASGAWFYAEAAAELGASTSVGVAAGGDFALDTRATLTEAMAEARAFYLTGVVRDVGTATPIAPLSTTSPKTSYSPFTNGSGLGTGLWSLANVSGLIVGYAVRSMYECAGWTAVSAYYEWLLGFTSDTTLEPTVNGQVRTYDPTYAPATSLNLSTLKNASATYDLGGAGLMAPVHAASGRSFEELKDDLEIDREIITSPRTGVTRSPGPFGFLRLSGRLATTDTMSMGAAAHTGELYRYGPRAQGAIA